MGERTLEDFGWTPELSFYLDELGEPRWVPGRVVRVDREHFQVWTLEGTVSAELCGKIRFERGNHVSVGDWVALTSDGEHALIRALLPRRSCIARQAAGEATSKQVLAANVDSVLLVSGLDRDFNLRRIERAMALTWDGGATPVVVLNKADQCDDVAARVAEVERSAPGVSLYPVSATTGQGIDALASSLGPGKSFVLLGSSGVGKSTLLNRLLGDQRMETGPLRRGVEKGSHTTTHRQLFRLPSGALCIDTPGLRELALWGSDEGLADVFPEIERLAADCRFADCAHGEEPGCAVQAAVEGGSLPHTRLESWRKLQREYAYHARRTSEAASREADRTFGRMIKRVLAEKRGSKG